MAEIAGDIRAFDSMSCSHPERGHSGTQDKAPNYSLTSVKV